MAYMSSSAPLPQNGMDPLPAAEVSASNDRIMRLFMASRTGRERVYANLPTAESFYGQWPGLAVDASQIIPQSELGRESVLNGLTYPLDSFDPEAAGPQVISLNAGSSQDLTTSANAVIPNAAPVQLDNGLWFSGKNQFSTSSHPVTTSKRPFSFASRLKRGACGGGAENSGLGPGCPPISPAVRRPPVGYPAPPMAPDPPGPEPLTVARGMGAFAPGWGQVEVMPGASSCGASRTPWLLILGGAAALVALTAKKKRGRR